jgi:ABC-type transporter Mla subunit MlaD
MWPFNKMSDEIHEIRKSGNIFFLLNTFLGAYSRRTDVLGKLSSSNNSEILTAINNLDRKVDEFMATQEERLQGVNTALSSIADGINTLQQQVADLKASNPALDDEISAIEGTVKAIADDINGVVPDAGGGDTGGNAGGTGNVVP